ncbi:hypothetical protein B0H17DRAFT_1135472 [Mycena rosella]|uniref:Uncharacterized protein n=1 Tax=Mycena rosella TaxID=1033263 RepID=A0AAD7GFJ9_MYCRO|nr:hypothetical protein B0H17DRAFT_1135472 [Mycena rosella]
MYLKVRVNWINAPFTAYVGTIGKSADFSWGIGCMRELKKSATDVDDRVQKFTDSSAQLNTKIALAGNRNAQSTSNKVLGDGPAACTLGPRTGRGIDLVVGTSTDKSEWKTEIQHDGQGISRRILRDIVGAGDGVTFFKQEASEADDAASKRDPQPADDGGTKL